MNGTLENARKLLSPAYRMKKLYNDFSPTGAPIVREGGKKVLFIPWYSRQLFFLRETFLAKACEFRGATTALLHCDIRIAPTENGNLEKRYGIKNPEINGGAAALKHLGQRQLKASAYYIPIDRDKVRTEIDALAPDALENYTYRNIQLGELVVASAIRKTLGMGPEWDDPSFRSHVLELLMTCRELVDLFTRVYEDFQPDEIVMSHGVYVTWGTAYRVARSMGINVSVYNGSYRKNTVRFYHNAPNAPFPEADWPRFKNVPLTTAETRWAEKYFQSRLNLDDENLDIFEGAEDPEKLSVFIAESKAKGQKLAALFTNMSWDSYAFSDHTTFGGMMDWARQTLEFARKRPDFRLIFKIHPAEEYFNVPERYRIKNHLGDVPDNVLILTEKDKVKPNLFYKEIDFGLINISTVCIEMALLNLPVLTSGANGHYEGNGFTLSPTNKEDYFSKLNQLIDDPGSYVPDREMALRYLFYRFHREAIVYEPLQMDASLVDKINIDTYKDLSPGKMPGLDCLADGIMTGAPFLLDSKYLEE